MGDISLWDLMHTLIFMGICLGFGWTVGARLVDVFNEWFYFVARFAVNKFKRGAK